MKESTVSIIIPVYNGAEYLVETLQSVKGQIYRPIELIVIDDGSSDDTPSLAESWLSEHASSLGFTGRLLRQKHRGGAAARNLGLSMASGEWIQFLDADDTFSDDKIATQVVALQGTEKKLAYCRWRYLYMDEGSVLSGDMRQPQPLSPGVDPLKRHLEGWFCPIHAYLWPRTLLQFLGGFDSSLAADQDADLLMRGLVAGAELRYTPKVEVQYRLHGLDQVSQSRSHSKHRSRLRVILKISHLLDADGRLDDYRESLAVRCDDLERSSCLNYRAFSRLCHKISRQLAPDHRAVVRGGPLYRVLRKLFGLYGSEWLSLQKRRLLESLK